MTAPIFRSVDALSGEVASTKFFEAVGPTADARIAELEALRAENAALKSEVPEWAQLAHDIRRLTDRYCAHADEEQHAALSNLADLMWYSGRYAAAVSRELHHWASAADDADTARREAVEALEELQASELGDVQAHNNELFHQNGELRRRIQVLETALAQAVSEREPSGSGHV